MHLTPPVTRCEAFYGLVEATTGSVSSLEKISSDITIICGDFTYCEKEYMEKDVNWATSSLLCIISQNRADFCLKIFTKHPLVSTSKQKI